MSRASKEFIMGLGASVIRSLSSECLEIGLRVRKRKVQLVEYKAGGDNI
jgi:hypothetical protein